MTENQTRLPLELTLEPALNLSWDQVKTPHPGGNGPHHLSHAGAAGASGSRGSQVSPQAPGRGVNWRGGPHCGASWKVPALCLGLAEERVVGCLWPSSPGSCLIFCLLRGCCAWLLWGCDSRLETGANFLSSSYSVLTGGRSSSGRSGLVETTTKCVSVCFVLGEESGGSPRML